MIGFDEASVRRIVRSVLFTERTNRSRPKRARKNWRPFEGGSDQSFSAICYVPPAGIPPISGLIPGKATCGLWRIAPASGFLQGVDDGTGNQKQAYVYNFASRTIEGSQFRLATLIESADGEGAYVAEPKPSSGGGIIAKTPTGSSSGNGIDAWDGTTLGHQVCDLYKIQSGQLVATGGTLTIYNMATQEIPLDTWIQAKIEQTSGLAIADWEECVA